MVHRKRPRHQTYNTTSVCKQLTNHRWMYVCMYVQYVCMYCMYVCMCCMLTWQGHCGWPRLIHECGWQCFSALPDLSITFIHTYTHTYNICFNTHTYIHINIHISYHGSRRRRRPYWRAEPGLCRYWKWPYLGEYAALSSASPTYIHTYIYYILTNI